MEYKKIQSYKDLIVWQKSSDLAILVYKLTKSFPKEELYGITSQIRRAAVSIPSNIAEGSLRGTKKDFNHFLRIAMGSAAELQTQLIIANRLTFGQKTDYNEIENILIQILKMLHSLSSTLH